MKTHNTRSNLTATTRKLVSKIASMFVFLVGSIVLMGWMLDIPTLKSISPSLVSMKANTAIAFLLAGLALLFLNNERTAKWPFSVAQTCAVVVALLGGVSLSQYLFGVNLGIDQLFFAEPVGSVGTSHPGRMAPATAFNFLLVGISLLFASRKAFTTASILVSVVGAVVFFSLLGYVFDISFLYNVGPFTPMALHTSLTFLFLAASFLSFRANLDSQFIMRAGFWAAVVTLFYIGVISYFHTMSQIEDAKRVTHTHEVLQQLEEILSDIKDVETSVRGYVITGNEQYLEPYYAQVDRVATEIDKLRRFTTDNSYQQRQIDLLEPLVKSKVDFMRETMNTRRAKGLDATVTQHYHSPRGEQLMNEIRAIVGEMEHEEQRLLKERNIKSEQSTHYAVLTLIVGTSVSFILLAAIFLLLVRENRIRRQSEVAIKESEQRLALTLESGQMGAWDLDLIHDTSVRTLKHDQIFGYDSLLVEWGAKRFMSHVLLEDREHAQKRFEKAFETGVLDFECRIVRPDKSLRWIFAHGKAYYNDAGKPVRMMGIVTDITERKRIEDEIRTLNAELERRVAERTAELRRAHEIIAHSEKRYRELIDNSLVGVYESTLHGELLFANRALLELLEFEDLEEMKAEGVILRYKDPKRREELIRRLQKEGVVANFEIEVLSKSHKSLYLLLNATIENDRLSGMALDITDRKKAEEEIRELNAELEQRVIERTAQLEAANKELESFSYSVSHDLRAPLRSIDGFSQALVEDLGDGLDERARDHLHRVRAASQRMGELIDDMLDLSRVTRAEIQRQQVNLSDMALAVVHDLRKTQPERGLEVQIAEGVNAYGDARLLRVVLDNLLGNAWKFTSKLPKAKIEFGFSDIDGKPGYYVRDNGAGFDMTYADKLFNAFQRLHAITEFPGNGIGLATVQRIIHRHGGKVWAEGAVEKGATFYFTIG